MSPAVITIPIMNAYTILYSCLWCDHEPKIEICTEYLGWVLLVVDTFWPVRNTSIPCSIQGGNILNTPYNCPAKSQCMTKIY